MRVRQFVVVAMCYARYGHANCNRNKIKNTSKSNKCAHNYYAHFKTKQRMTDEKRVRKEIGNYCMFRWSADLAPTTPHTCKYMQLKQWKCFFFFFTSIFRFSNKNKCNLHASETIASSHQHQWPITFNSIENNSSKKTRCTTMTHKRNESEPRTNAEEAELCGVSDEEE